MKKLIEEVANILMYSGPTINEIIQDAVSNGKNFYTKEYENIYKVIVDSTLPYEIKMQDQYWYNENRELIKQIIVINGKEKVIFDKFVEAKQIIERVELTEVMVS